MNGLSARFKECASEKNCTLIRYDIIVNLKQIYDAVEDETVKAKALELIETEDDLKYKKKYAGVWKNNNSQGLFAIPGNVCKCRFILKISDKFS